MQQPYILEAELGAEGEGAEVKRLFPVKGIMYFDPFVLWDDFTVPPSAGFPDHPHRGFEGVTYVFEGSMQHKDNLGNQSTVTVGGLQRFTAGKGIVHSEMPAPGSTTRGIQLWVNLPQRLKKLDPDYQQVDSDVVPENSVSNGTVRVLAGQGSPLKLQTPVRYLDVALGPKGEFKEQMPAEFRGFVYMVDGQAEINGDLLTEGHAMFFDGEAVVAASADAACRFMVCFGRPHGEPVYQHGPYVD